MIRDDKLTRDIRSRLKEVAKGDQRGVKLFKGTARMFLDSTGAVMANSMPTLGNMLEMNRDLLSDTMRFMRTPSDAVSRGLSMAMGSEDVRSLKKLGKNMLNDLKTGNIYDPKRDRTEFGERTRDLLNNFGGIDMGGFQADGSYVEPGSSSDRNFERSMMEQQESNADTRTVATLDAISRATQANIANDNVNHQQTLRLSIKQHSQLMAGMSNLVTQQAATLQAVNTLSSSLLEVTRESHRQVMDTLNQTNQLLSTIAMNTTPPEVKNRPGNSGMDFMSANGSIDVRKYLKAVVKNANSKYNISSTMSMMTGGMGVKGMADMLQNNPWMAVSTALVEKMLPEYLKQTMETTQKYMENFIPSLLTKFADRGRRFENAAPGEKKLSDFVMGLLGVTPKAGKPGVDNVLRDPNAQAVLTNRTVHAIEQVIPMWLSRIYSGITGEDLGMYNYRTGRMEKAKYALARETHSAHDYVGRMGSGAYAINERARQMKFKDPKKDAEFQEYVYRYLNGAAADGRTLINPYKSKKTLMDELPEGDDIYKDALIAVLRSMPRNELMKLPREIQQARQSRYQSGNQAYTDLQESGLSILFSGVMDKNTQRKIMAESKKKRYGLSESDIDDIVAENRARPIQNGARAVRATNTAVNDILDVLNRGIITYTYILGGANSFKNGTPPGFDAVQKAQQSASSVQARLEHIDTVRKENKQAEDARRYAERQRLDQSRARNRLINTGGSNRTTFEQLLEQQRDLNVDMSGFYTLDNPETQAYLDKQRANETKDFLRKQFGIKGGRGVDASPFRLANQALETMDSAMFKFIFGEDVPEGYGDNGNQVTSFMHTMELRLKGEWQMAKEWFSENIGAPLKDFFLGENSIIGRTVNTAKQRATEAMTKFGNRVKDRFMERHGGDMDRLKARGQDTGSAVANVMMDAVDRFLYGDLKEGHGKQVDKDGSVTYGGFLGRMRRAGDRFQTFMFGADPDKDPNESRKKFDFLKKELNIAAPDMIIGGGLGLLGSMLLPGGPILGAMLGMGAGLVKGSETFQNFLFGEKMTREVTVIGSDGNPVMVRDPKTHKLVPKTRKIDSRRGGLIDGPIYDGIKNYLPKVGGGAAAGWVIGGGLLPGLAGNLIGSFAGALTGLVASSDRLKRMLFGDEEDESGDSGLFSKNMREKVLKAIRDHGGGMIAGKVAGSLAGTVAGGLLPGAIGAMVGPVLGSIGAVTGFFAGPKLMNMIFGEEAEVETVDPKTGKKIKKKERMGGMFGKIYDATRDELVRPFAEKMNAVGTKMSDWFHESIIDPLARAMDPAKKAMHDAGEAITNSIRNIGDRIFESLNNAIGMPLKDFTKEKIITPLSNITSRIFSVVGKIVGGVVSAPFKAMEYIFTGSVQGASAKERKRRHKRQDRENLEQLRKADREAKRNRDKLRDTTGALEDVFGPDDDYDEAFDEGSEEIQDKARKAVDRENRRERRKADREKSVRTRSRIKKNAEAQETRNQLRMAQQTEYGANPKDKPKAKKVVAASGVGAKAGVSGRTVGRIYDALLDIRKDVARIRSKLDNGSGSGYSGGGRRRGPGLIGSILGLPFKLAGAAARGAGDVAGGVIGATGKVLKGGVHLAGDVLALPFTLLTAAGRIAVSAVSGVASALGSIVGGLTHLVTGGIGLMGHMFGSLLNILGTAGVGIAKGAWDIATVVPRAAAGIVGYGAKTAGALIGGGLKLAGSVISAPFKLIGGILGGGRKHPPADYKPIGPMKDTGRSNSAQGRAPRGGNFTVSGLDQFGVRTSQGLALRVWQVGSSDIRADIESDSVHKAERKQDMKEKKEDRRLQRQQLKIMDRMDKRQHRQQIFGILASLFGGSINNLLSLGLGNTLKVGATRLADTMSEKISGGRLGKIPLINKLLGVDSSGMGLGSRISASFMRSTMQNRLIAVGTPEAPHWVVPKMVNGILAIPVYIAGSYDGTDDGGSGGPGPDDTNPRVDPSQSLAPYTGGDGSSRAGWRDRARNAWNRVKPHNPFRRNRKHRSGMSSRLRSFVGGLFRRFRRGAPDYSYSGPATVGEMGPEWYSPNGALTGEIWDGAPVGMNGPEIIDVGPADVVVPNHVLPTIGANVPGFAGGYNWKDLLNSNRDLLNQSINNITGDDGFVGSFKPLTFNRKPRAATTSVAVSNATAPKANPLANLRQMISNRRRAMAERSKHASAIYESMRDRIQRKIEHVPSSISNFTDVDYVDASTGLSTAVKRPGFGGFVDGVKGTIRTDKSKLTSAYQKAYARFNRMVAKSKRPKDTFDRIVLGAHSDIEIQAAKDVQQLDSGSSLMVLNNAGGEKKKGIFQTIIDAFSNVGGGLKGLAAVGSTLFGGLLGPLSSILKFGGTVLGNVGSAAIGTAGVGTTLLAGGIGTTKALITGDTGHAASYAARTASSVGSKLLAGFSKVLSGFLNSKTVSAAMAKLGQKPGVVNNIATKAFAKASGSAAAAASASKLLSKAFWPILIGTAVVDFGTGMANANEHFNVRREGLTDGMRVAAGLAKAISGIAFGLIPIDWLAQTLWKIFAKSEDKEKLAIEQENYKTIVDTYNKANGTNYSVEEFQDNFKETASGDFVKKKHPIRNFFQKVGGVVGEGFKGIGGEIKNMLSMTKSALTGHPLELLNYKTQTNVANDNWTSTLMKLINVPIKVSLLPLSVVTMVGKAIGKTIGDTFGGVVSSVKALGDYGKFIATGDMTGLLDYDPASQIGDKNMLKPVFKVMSIGMKATALLPTGISWGAHRLFNAIGDVVKPILGDTNNFETDMNNMKAFVESGDPKGLINYTLNDSTGGLYSGINRIAKVAMVVPAALNWLSDNVMSNIPIIGDFFDRDYAKKGVNADGSLKAGYIKDESTGNVRKMTSAEKKADKENQRELIKRDKAYHNYEVQQKGGIKGFLNRFVNGKVENPYANTEAEYGTGPVKSYSQRDHRWSGMAEDGCGPTAAAMVASAYGNNVTPGQMNQMSYGMGMRSADGGTNPAFFTKMANQFGRGAFRMQQGPVSGNAMAAAAQAGQPVTVMGRGGVYGGGEHYMVLEGAYGKGKTAVLRDPLTGGRKTTPMSSLVNATDTAIYSKPGAAYGRGWGRGEDVVDSRGNRTTTQGNAAKVQEGQQALVNQMQMLANNKIAYSLSGPQDPDQGSASCASTVGWAYRKVFGEKGMSASTAEQSKDSRFQDIVRLGNPGAAPGRDFDLNLLQPGDIVYMKNPGSNHTEMYIGNGMDLSHGGGSNGTTPGPNPVKLDENRRKKVFAVRRYKPFMNGVVPTFTNPGLSSSSGDGYSTSGGSTSGTASNNGNLFSFFETLLGNFSKLLKGEKLDDVVADETSVSSNESVGTSTHPTLAGNSDTEKIWRFLRKNLGLTPIAAAGVMGNFQAESSNNPHRMEADYTGAFQKIGFEKMASDANVRDKWVKEYLWPIGYKNASWLNRDAYYGDDGHTYPGFGLAQWTGPRGYKLFKFAKDNGLNWTDLAAQLDFFANASGEFKDRGLVEKMNAAGNTNDSTYTFAKYYEGNTTLAQAERKENARQFYDMYKDLDVSEENSRAQSDNDRLAAHYGRGPATVYGSSRPMFGRGSAPTLYGYGTKAWGRGIIADTAHNAREVTRQIASMNERLRKQRTELDREDNVQTMTKAITDSLGQSNGGSEALLQTIANTLASMLQVNMEVKDLLAKAAEAATTKPEAPDATEVNKAYAYPPKRAAHYANGETDGTDIGADIVRRLTTAY